MKMSEDKDNKAHARYLAGRINHNTKQFLNNHISLELYSERSQRLWGEASVTEEMANAVERELGLLSLENCVNETQKQSTSWIDFIINTLWVAIIAIAVQSLFIDSCVEASAETASEDMLP